jgi:hypothetical protein
LAANPRLTASSLRIPDDVAPERSWFVYDWRCYKDFSPDGLEKTRISSVAKLNSFLKPRLRELSGVEGRQVVRLPAEFSPIHLPPMADGHNNDSQNLVVDFVNHPVVAHADAPGTFTTEFFATSRVWLGFQSGKRRQNSS